VTYVIECHASIPHLVRGERPLLGFGGPELLDTAITHAGATGHPVSVYRYQGDREELVLRMAAVGA
jgi:hypothetical protein